MNDSTEMLTIDREKHYLKTTFRSASNRSKIKINKLKVKTADPPLLKNGKGIPITGAKPVTIPIFIMK